jgi:hypothetical protein
VKAVVTVEEQAEGTFHVTVREGRGETTHVVTLARSYHDRLTGGRVSPAELVRRSFDFLLEREPKESILARFELPVIGRYFPEYEREMKARLES